MTVPIKNLYLLLLYAWDLLDTGETVDVGNLETQHPQNLLAYVLFEAIERIVRRGFDRTYVTNLAESSTIRGSIDFGETVRRGSLQRCAVVCRADELSVDSLENRVLKSTLGLMLRDAALDADVRKSAVALHSMFSEVRNISLVPTTFTKVQIHRSNRNYSLPIQICRIYCEAFSPEQHGSGAAFIDFFKDPIRMRSLFESFVRNLLRYRLNANFTVGRRRQQWFDIKGNAEALELVPTLNFDVLVETAHCSLIIDTKFTPNSLSERWTRKRYRTEHLYQMFAYLENYASTTSRAVEGLLLYPAVNGEWQEEIMIRGKRMRFSTVSLNDTWSSIEARIVTLASDFFQPVSVNSKPLNVNYRHAVNTHMQH